MSGHVFGTDNTIPNSTLSMISGSTANTQFPLSNLQIDITAKAFRSNEASANFLIDTGTISDIDTFMVVGDNTVGLGVSAISIYGSTTTDFSASSEIVIDISQENNFGFKQFTSVNFRYWKVELTGSTYCELSNIYLGKATSITTNAIALGSFKYTVKENLKVSANKYGNRFIDKYNSQKSLSGSLKLLNTAEYDIIREIANDHKRSEPIWFITDTADFLGTNAKYIYSGFFYFSKDFAFSNTNTNLWSTSLNFIEIT